MRDALLDEMNDLGAVLKPTPTGRTYTSGAVDAAVAGTVGDVAGRIGAASTAPFDDEAT